MSQIFFSPLLSDLLGRSRTVIFFSIAIISHCHIKYGKLNPEHFSLNFAKKTVKKRAKNTKLTNTYA